MNLPSKDYRRVQIVVPKKLYKGLDSVVNAAVGKFNRRKGILKRTLKEAVLISESAKKFREISNQELKKKIRELKSLARVGRHREIPFLIEALSVLIEAADRTLGLRPFPVQVAGALTLYRGFLAEMATGEGKSLTACLPAIVSGWTGKPCHIITVNDYLANRDAIEMKSYYRFCGVSVGCVTGKMDPDERKLNYEKDIVYTTSKEIVADFLRDRLIMGSLSQPTRRLIRKILFHGQREDKGLVLRGLDTAIVDEADSVLIDEAVTPLIISQLQENKMFTEVYRSTGDIAKSMVPNKDYEVNFKYKEIHLKRRALSKIAAQADSLPGIWKNPVRSEELIRQALSAREFYHRDEQYVIQDGRVVIVDEFTGRLMPDRTWRQGFHQAVEAMENIELTDPSETLARISFQQFFRLFKNLSGMTGTASEASGEFWQIYGLPVIKIPTNKPCIRTLFKDRLFKTADEKWLAIKNEIVNIHNTGRPVLVGTRNVFASEKLATLLAAEKLEFNLLNAVRHEEEAAIIRVAGESGRITISTNMAGRGTDIKLHGKVPAKGGLHVIATERHESGRIDRQLFGRSARQGDPGNAQAFVSLEDELIKRFVPQTIQQQLKKAVETKVPGSEYLSGKILSYAQRAAQHLAYRQRKNVLKMDTWLEEALSFSGAGSYF